MLYKSEMQLSYNIKIYYICTQCDKSAIFILRNFVLLKNIVTKQKKHTKGISTLQFYFLFCFNLYLSSSLYFHTKKMDIFSGKFTVNIYLASSTWIIYIDQSI